MNTALSFKAKKIEQRKISISTCYDYTSAQIINSTEIDAILVGDSVSMVIHGHSSTVHATMDMMAMHTAAVSKGAPDKFLIADMPFLSYRKSTCDTLNNVQLLMKQGAHAIKLEGTEGNLETIRHIVDSGVPVMGHLGLTPQFVNQFGGFKVQGKNATQAKEIHRQAIQLQEAGCFSIVLECVPSPLGEQITQKINIPTIGIGAGPHTDGQILVFQDFLGMQKNFQPKFVKKYLNGFDLIQKSLNSFHQDIVNQSFPSKQESYE